MKKRRYIKKSNTMPNPEPTFFFGSSGGNVSADNIEREPYRYHWAIYSAVRVISWNLRRLPRAIYDVSNKIVAGGDAMELLSRPNPYMTLSTLIEAIICGLLLPGRNGVGGGQCFLICDSGAPEGGDYHVDLAAGQTPAAIFPYYSDAVKPWQENGKFRGWYIEPVQGKKMYYEPHQIIRIYNYDPYSWFSGISSYQPALLAILRDIKTDIWNNRVFDNDAIPSGVLTSETALDDKTMQEAERRWYSKYSGPGNARRIAILGKGLKFQPIGLNPADMQYQEMKTRDIDSITATFGLNKIARGDYESINYATIVEGRKMLWEDTYKPIDEHINESLTVQWIRFLDPAKQWKLKSDYSGVRILQKDITKNVASAKTMVDVGVPPELAFQKADIPFTAEEIQKYPWLSEKVTPAPSPFGLTGEQPTGLSLTPEKNKTASPASQIITLKKKSFSEKDRELISTAYIGRVLDPGENFFFNQLIKFFNEQRNEMMDKVDEWAKKTQKAVDYVPPNTNDLLFNEKQATDDLAKIYLKLVYGQAGRETVKLKEELGDIVLWSFTPDNAADYAKKRRSELKRVNGTTSEYVLNHVNDAIAQGIKDNITVMEMAKNIKAAISDVGEIRKNQSKTIARTETGIISSDLRFDCFKTEGYEFHQWISAGDEKVRETHQEEGGVIVRIGDVFPHTGLLHPLDQNGAVEEIINCRCTTVIVEG